MVSVGLGCLDAVQSTRLPLSVLLARTLMLLGDRKSGTRDVHAKSYDSVCAGNASGFFTLIASPLRRLVVPAGHCRWLTVLSPRVWEGVFEKLSRHFEGFW